MLITGGPSKKNWAWDSEASSKLSPDSLTPAPVLQIPLPKEPKMKKAQQIFKSMTIEQVYSRAEIKENAKLDSKQVYQPLILLVKEGVVTRDGDLYTRVKIHRAQSAMKGTPWSKTVNPIRTEAMKIVPGNLETVASCIAALERLAKDRALIKSRLTDLIDKY